MTGLIVILLSFLIAAIVRVILKKKNDCTIVKTIPQLIMLGGGLIGAYLFLQDNWSSLG